MKNKNLTFDYLSHIDALRALSVVLVIFFHLNPDKFYLGYLGVDVFFVISGYVITNSLYQEQYLNKKSILIFYLKRFKRIYPILFLVIVAFIFIYIFFSPLSGNTNFYLGSAITALLGISNFYFINNEINYFLNDGVNPLLHTWSLGIEEQFYILYPIFIVTLLRNNKNNLNFILFSVLILLILSFVIYFNFSGIIANFYFPLSRFWELGIGCFAFFFPILKSRVKIIIILFLLSYLLISIFGIDNTYSIKTNNLITTIITFIIIIFSRNYLANKKITYLINLSKLPYLGKLSYSIYLWHLPILYFCEIYLSGYNKYIIFFTTTLMLSALSYHLYEIPFRKKDYIDIFFKKVFKFRVVLIVGFTLLIIFSSQQDYKSILDYAKKFNYPERKLSNFLSRLDHNHKNYLKNECNDLSQILECEVSNKFEKVIYLTGDSHANHLLTAVDGLNNIKKFYFNGLAECEIIRKHIININYTDFKYCDESNSSLLNSQKFINKFNQNNIIIISLRLSDYFGEDWKVDKNSNPGNLDKKSFIKQKYLEFFKLFPKSKIVLVSAIPESKIMTEKCIFNEYLNQKINEKVYNKCHFKKTNDIKRYLEVEVFLKDIQLDIKNLNLYSPYNILCPGDICHNYDNENDFFLLHDKDHLSIEASKFLSKHLKAYINQL